jgi:superfamily II DNA helicase RecQ
MKDQVDALISRKINVACLDSTKTRDESHHIHNDLRAGRLKLLYCAPERVNSERFIESIKQVRGGVRLVAVDEAHCISEVWPQLTVFSTHLGRGDGVFACTPY